MKFDFSRQNLQGREYHIQRLFEIIPGLTSWTILIGLTTLAFVQPIIAAVIIIAFDLFWLMRLLYTTIFLLLSYFRLRLEQSTDWMARVHGIDELDTYLKAISANLANANWKKQLILKVHYKELLGLKETGALPPRSQNIVHLVIFPVAKEPLEIIEPALASISRQDFPIKQIVVAFALEEHAPESTKQAVSQLAAKYKSHFLDLLVVIHPTGIPGEARVKGANATFAAKKAAQYFKDKNIPFENIIASCFDADTVVGDKYFSCLTYYFMVTPNRRQASFQPIPVYHNNIWEVPGFARVMESGSSFFQLIEATHPEKLVTFSSHSMSFQALTEVGYWPVDLISDDSAIFWKCFIHYDGNYDVIPMYVTLSMDVAAADTFWSTVKSIYKQKRRWAWGVENFPIVVRAFLKADQIPLSDRIRYGFKLFESQISWATWGFILTFISWIPVFFAGQQFRNTVLFYNTPQITSTIFHLASLSFIISVAVSLALLPKHHSKFRWLKKIIFALEWCTIPFVLVFLSALPALDAQTRLMLGRYMEFWVTVKSRKK